jgi:transposase
MNAPPRKKTLALVQGEGKRKSGPILGVDVHKTLLAFCVLSETRILQEDTVPNTKVGITELLSLCRHYSVRSTAMEATAQYHFPLMFALQEEGLPFLVANPLQTRETQGKKTDKLDARRIALAHRDGRLKPSVISPRTSMHLRKNNRTILRLLQDQTRCKQRLQQAFHLHDCHPPKLIKGFLRTKWTIDLFHAVLTTDKMISELMEQYNPRNQAQRTTQDRERIQRLCTLLETFRIRLTPLETQIISTDVAQLRLFQTLLAQRRLTNYFIAKTTPELQTSLRILLSVPGIGPDTAFCILAELVDINYFPSPAKLAKWAGLAPRVHQSGHRKHITGKLHKGGNKYLRRALTLVCTNIYARGDETHPIRQFIRAKYKQTQKYWLAICAGGRKLLTILWYLLQRGQQWNPPTETDPKVLKTLQTKIQKKIQAHERQIARYDRTQERLTQILTGQLSNISVPTQDGRELLRRLLKAT